MAKDSRTLVMRAMAKASRTLGQARQRLASAGSAPALGASPWLVGRVFPQAPRAACLVPAVRNCLPQVVRPCWRRGCAPARPQLARLRYPCQSSGVCPGAAHAARRLPPAPCPFRGTRCSQVSLALSLTSHCPRVQHVVAPAAGVGAWGGVSAAVSCRWMGTRVATPWVDPREYEGLLEDAAAEAAEEQDDARFGLPNQPRGYRRADSRSRAPQLVGRDQIPKMPIQSTISINRIAVVRKGGKVLKFAAIVVCGNGKGTAAIGKGKDKEVARAVEKAVARAHRMQAMHYFELYDNRTVFHDTSAKFKQTKVLIMAPREGTGLTCNNALSLICEAIGIKDLQAKVHGSNNAHNMVAAFWKALLSVRTPEQVGRIRGKAVIDYASLKAGLGPGHSTVEMPLSK